MFDVAREEEYDADDEGGTGAFSAVSVRHQGELTALRRSRNWCLESRGRRTSSRAVLDFDLE